MSNSPTQNVCLASFILRNCCIPQVTFARPFSFAHVWREKGLACQTSSHVAIVHVYSTGVVAGKRETV